MKLSQLHIRDTNRWLSVIKRFWKKVNKTKNGCWEWSGCKWKSGYGQIKVRGKRWKAHRMSFLIHHGYLDETLCVLHKCDNRACVRPDHLYQGTKGNNAEDCVNRERTARGTKNALAKLTEPIVAEMRRQYAKRTAISISKQYDVSCGTACNAIYGKTWKHVKEKAPRKYFKGNQHR